MSAPVKSANVVPICLHGNCFPIIHVPENAPEELEHAGTTIKFWLSGRQLLYKQARKNTGEDWSEKITSELAGEVGLPTVYVELAIWKTIPGIVTGSFVQPGETFVEARDFRSHLLQQPRENLPKLVLDEMFKMLEEVEPPLRWKLPKGLSNAADVFVGYLAFDAWICNEDRHHGNWGVVDAGTPRYHLAPTFDHASSLGREFTDEQRTVMLTTGQIDEFVGRCRSGIFAAPTAKDPLAVHELLAQVATLRPAAVRYWLERILALPVDSVEMLFDRLPTALLTPIRKTMALELMSASRLRLKQLHSSLPPR